MKAIQKITSVFLAAVFLFSSLGFTISSMVCLKSGKGKVSFSSIEDCCAKPQAASIAKKGCCAHEEELDLPEGFAIIKKGECCDINNYTFNLKDFQSSQKQSLEQPAISQSLFYSSEIVSSTVSENKLAFQYSDLPPPLYGRTLLNFISTLTI
jgi:hypothetical protein